MANLTKPVLGWSGRQLRRIVTGASAAAAIMVVTFIGAASFTTSASAQQQVCLLHDVAVDKLQAQYGEQVSGRGLAQEGRAMVELFRSETGSWTLVITDVNGRSCVMATGEAWHDNTLKGEVSS